MDPTPETYREARRVLDEAIGNIVDRPQIIDAFRQIPRHLFVPPHLAEQAYDDRALPLVEGQTISQPTMIALMLDALDPHPGDRVLEVGAGSGYAAALLSVLVREVHAVEIRPTLVPMAREALAKAGIGNVRVHLRDGSLGLPEFAPFDRILVSAGTAIVPEPLVSELAPGGRLVIPIGTDEGQRLQIARRSADGASIEWERGAHCLFVPLVHGSRHPSGTT